MYNPFVEKYLDYVSWIKISLIHATGFILSIFHIQTTTEPGFIIKFTGGRGVIIAMSCVGYGVYSFWIAFVAANKGRFLKKFLWIVSGLLGLWFINVIRITLFLTAINKSWPMPLGIGHHTWFTIFAYLLIFFMIWLFDKSLKKDVAKKKNFLKIQRRAKNMNTDLSSYNNSWYQPGSSVKRFCWYFINLFIFKNSFFPFYKLKVFLLRLFGAKTGKNILIKPNVNIKYPWFLEIGDNVWLGENVWIDNLGKISIGNNVCLSQGAMLLSGNHDYTKSTFDLIVKEIILEDGVWIAARSIVCGGIICKDHSVLSAGSVATQNLESFSIYAGNPAVKIRERKSDDGVWMKHG